MDQQTDNEAPFVYLNQFRHFLRKSIHISRMGLMFMQSFFFSCLSNGGHKKM